MKKIYEETRLIPLTVVKTCKKGGGFYMPPTCVKTYKKGGGFYMPPPLALKLMKKVVGSI